jgi:hypothetical protein
LAYFGTFLITMSEEQPRGVLLAGLSRLRLALESAGIAIGGSDDLGVWAAAVERFVAEVEASAANASQAHARRRPLPRPSAEDARVTENAVRASAEMQENLELADLFADDQMYGDEHGEDDLSAMFDDEAQLETREEPAVKSGAVVEEPVSPMSVAKRAPLRPQLFPQGGIAKTKPRRGAARKPRVSATAPDTGDFDVPPGEGREYFGVVDEKMSEQMRQLVEAARPVFSSNLIQVAGSMDAVSSWEEQCRNKGDVQLRFVAAKKGRHANLGSLILPFANERTAKQEYLNSFWGELAFKFFGVRLYELGVVVQKLLNDIVSYKVEGDQITLRLHTQRGLVGMVIVNASDVSEESQAVLTLIETLSELLKERLNSVVVLVTTDGKKEPVIEALVAGRQRRGWVPSMPVIAAYSWEYAADQGASATLVLGD